MARQIIYAICAGLMLAPGAAHAQVRAQPAPAFDPAPGAQPPIRIPAPTPPVLRADPARPPLSSASIARPPLRLPGPDNPALDADVARLRAAALATPNSARASRAQASAAWIMGLLYVHGIGVTLNLAEAADWFERARRGGEPLAAAGLAWCEIEGCKAAPNPNEARRWIAALRGVNPARAQYLQWLLESRLRPLQIATPGAAQTAAEGVPNRQLLVAAAQAGDVQARIELGFDSITTDQEAAAVDYFRAAAAQSAAAAANVEFLNDGARKAKSPAASSQGADTLAKAQRNHRGEGQSANFVEAIRLYRLAQSQGSEQARKMLELIFSRPGADGQIDIAWMQQLAYANLTKDVAQIGSPTDRRTLRRDPTPLFDLLPANWRKYALQVRR